MDPAGFKSQIVARLKGQGFDAAGIAPPAAIAAAGEKLSEFLAAGRHGEMTWMAAHAERRADPRVLWPEVRSVIVAAMNYGPHSDPMETLERHDRGTVSVYARNRDYHDVMKGKLKQTAGWMHGICGARVKVFVDTAPVLEKPLAAAAGVGWQGKHTNLVSRELGSWLFLGSIFTDMELPPDQAETDHCGSCRACLDICPTDAFPAPYQLDARRCISYLTIEHKGTIPRALRGAMGNRIYGCDDCLAVCPWNKFARTAREAQLRARDDLAAPRLADLARLDDAGFRGKFSGSPIKRIGRDRFVRNVLIAAGNSGDEDLLPVAFERLDDDAPQVRAMAVWAIGRLCDEDRYARLKAVHLPQETADEVRDEWLAPGAVT
jgi:epoxyqueuosine reductase